jgi:hypothetical protein
MIVDRVRKDLSELLEQSPYLRTIERLSRKAAPSVLFGDRAQPLQQEQIDRLRRHSCSAEDWTRVLATPDFDPGFTWGVHFAGLVVLGRTGRGVKVEGVRIPSGLYRSVIVDCEIGDDVLIQNAGFLANAIVDESAVVQNVGTVSSRGARAYGNGIEISVAIETGGREVRLYAEQDFHLAALVVRSRADRQLLEAHNDFVSKYAERSTSNRTIIARSARIVDTPKVLDSFVGEYALIDNALRVENATLLSSEEEPVRVTDGSVVQDSILQWGVEIETMSLVTSSLMVEHSHAERHAKVNESIIGPNSGIGEGEVTSSIVGPFVGFHHQSLLIAAYWPEGKGNVGYGANVGSNHTGKAPDQEIWCGEGTFFGLGTNIKMPADFTRAPYSLIATAVDTLPQRLEMPFSLVNKPSEVHASISPAYNEIMPGWVLSDNMFALKRSEFKYATRNKARRTPLEFEILRPEIIDLMIEARGRLESASGKDVYTDRDVQGLGKNYMTESSRLKGIDAYSFYLRYYALRGLYRKMRDAPDVSLSRESDDPRWEHERRVLNQEFDGIDRWALLRAYVQMEEEIVRTVEASKAKDDRRGQRVIEDYSDAHAPASEDALVVSSKEALARLRADVEKRSAGRG